MLSIRPILPAPLPRRLFHTTRVAFQYKRSTAPTALPLSTILRSLTKLFPLSVSESFEDFKQRKRLDKFQEQLLSSLSFYPQASHAKYAEVIKTKIDSKGNYINEFFIAPPGVPYEELNHLVVIHGYGAGLGFFLNNFEDIQIGRNWCIHAIDMLGYGTSSRPDFPEHWKDIRKLEGWFLDSMETWRVKRNLQNKVLFCSHSMGAYLSTLYTQKYPGNVDKLLMISPAGVIKPTHQVVKAPWWFEKLWDYNVSPFSIVRAAGPWGSKVVSGWSSRRFAKLDRAQKQLMHQYTYGIFNAKGSGEYFLSFALGVGGVPRKELLERIRTEGATCDMLWVYGSDDWMDIRGGIEATKIITNQAKPFESEVVECPHSGHHLYMDNAPFFNSLVMKEMDKLAKRL